MDEFLKRCFYHSGQYNSEEHFAELDIKLKEKEAGRKSNRLFYLSIPPNIFVDVVKCASLRASSASGWTRVIVEKPFGRDSESSGELTRSLKQYLREDQIFRIDHYLGKELVENLSVLRFSNLVFEPLWSRNYIRSVQFIFSEDFGTEGRGGYFDHYGIIRDIMQNHLLQILALFAMETPVSLDAEDIRNEKVKVLRSMKPLQLEDVNIGQYKGHSKGSRSYPAYTDDPTVPKDSLTPTFAAAVLFINNARWDGVPFLMKAGKALHTKRAEIRVQFRHVPGNLYRRNFGTDLDKATNELVLRVQPDEAIYLKINNKVPGLGMRLDRSDLNLLYRSRYPREIPDAYERLLLDAIEGERRLFIRSDELDAAWSLFTPLLKELEEKKIVPELYPYGSRGPVGAHYLAAKYNVRWGDLRTPEVSNCRNSSSLMSTSGCSSFDASAAICTLGMPVLLKAAFRIANWNADEEILLLEAIEMYGFGNWNEVAEHVGTKSKSQCIDHFNAACMNSPCFPLPDMSHVMGKSREELLAMAK
ncbi:hypothetical protein JRO89_XS03G0318400 [Xanthoceras sorbifolium]|uniref:Glucose-6-phosphate 1-dehydrogenase n=1 Tax=Xanthoceras sorbifolium TaxID=99658 RepID=A0ABQ8IDS1_9ROSI|nr:hypothetical protein JRO89_XS03G0318400 [Xanthoceras sorbifolium]